MRTGCRGVHAGHRSELARDVGAASHEVPRRELSGHGRGCCWCSEWERKPDGTSADAISVGGVSGGVSDRRLRWPGHHPGYRSHGVRQPSMLMPFTNTALSGRWQPVAQRIEHGALRVGDASVIVKVGWVHRGHARVLSVGMAPRKSGEQDARPLGLGLRRTPGVAARVSIRRGEATNL